MDRLVLLQFLLVLIAVPLQLIIVTKWSNRNLQQTKSIPKFTSQIKDFMHYFSPNTWFKWFISLAIDIPVAFSPELHKQTWQHDSQSPAVEVFHFREQYGYFASSPIIRSSRSNSIQYRVGQVIRHKTQGYRGVIIGWDETARAPDQWLRQYSQRRTQPYYLVLIDTRDQRIHKMYLPQESIESLTKMKIVNAQLTDYFTIFDGSRYRMKPWLKEQYPHD